MINQAITKSILNLKFVALIAKSKQVQYDDKILKMKKCKMKFAYNSKKLLVS